MSEGMTDEHFAHMLKLATVYIPILQGRTLLNEAEDMDEGDRHNAHNCLEIVADTFLEMQRRLAVKPVFRVQARAALTGKEQG